MTDSWKQTPPPRTDIDAGYFKYEPQPDPWARLPALAARLGVKPVPPGGPVRVILRTAAGQSFDVFELCNAVLDLVEKVTKAGTKT